MAKRQPPTSEPKAEIVPASLPELIPTQQDGIQILDFFNGWIQFAQRAMALELRAKQTLAEARALQPPTSKDEDEAIQTFIQRAAADEKEVDGAWAVTKIISAFHKRLTGARARATDPLAQSKDIAQRLHNRYVEDEHRRVEAVAAEARRKAEAAALEARRSELEALEAKALAAEKASPELSDRERFFVKRITFYQEQHPNEEMPNAMRAARDAGFKDAKHGLRLLQQPKVIAALSAHRASMSLRQQHQAVASKPLDIAPVAEVESQVGDAGSDRTRYGAEVFDLTLWRQGLKDGSIPLDTAVPHQPTMNEYGRSLRENISRWPGVKSTKSTRTV